jgi:trimethylamine:corrinoid methyltransferase-like protein
MQDLHETSIRILKEPGIKVMGANARALFAGAGRRSSPVRPA